MPRLLTVGHVTWDRRGRDDVLGGSVAYGSLTALKLGWEAGALTSAGPDFEPGRDLAGVEAFVGRAPSTTRFQNDYDAEGLRRQVLSARADDVELATLPDRWRNPDALLLGPVAGELPGFQVSAFEAGGVGAIAQGWLREVAADGSISPRGWPTAARDLAGVHVLFLSEFDLPRGAAARDFLQFVPIVVLTRGWEGVTLFTHDAAHDIPSLPRQEVDPTGAGDVFAAAFLVRYHEVGDPEEACAFAACAASCVVEGIGTSTLGDRAEVLRRMEMRDRLIEEGEWDE
ncbi:MAG TPA: PfkB family carbohydrate kinase [Vicinamibacteria bacterium]